MREYNPANGRFLSTDPVFEDNSPNQINGYDYAGNDPIAGSDPSGLFRDGCESGDVSHPELADLGRFISGQNKDINKQPYFAGVRIPTFNTLKKSMLNGVGYHEGEYGVAIQDWAAAQCQGINESNTSFCGAANKAGLLRQPSPKEALLMLASLALPFVAGFVISLVADAVIGGALSEGAALAADGAEEGTEASLLDTGCNSFAAGTAVLMADGSQEPIQDVKVGNQVTNADPDSTAPQQHTMTAIHVTDTDTDFTSLSVATATPNVGKCPNDPTLDHGDLGEFVTRERLIAEGYTNITPEVTFTNSQGVPFRANFVAQDPSGNWKAIESKTNTGGYTDNQALGYPEMETIGATLTSSKLSRYGIMKGDTVRLPLETDRWWCPVCH